MLPHNGDELSIVTDNTDENFKIKYRASRDADWRMYIFIAVKLSGD